MCYKPVHYQQLHNVVYIYIYTYISTYIYLKTTEMKLMGLGSITIRTERYMRYTILFVIYYKDHISRIQIIVNAKQRCRMKNIN